MELNKDEIIGWAVSWASYKELEDVSKALYGLYVQRRKAEKPEVHKRIKQKKKSAKITKKLYSKQKKQLKEAYPGKNGELIVRNIEFDESGVARKRMGFTTYSQVCRVHKDTTQNPNIALSQCMTD